MSARNKLWACLVIWNYTFSHVHPRSKIDGQLLMYFTPEQERELRRIVGATTSQFHHQRNKNFDLRALQSKLLF